MASLRKRGKHWYYRYVDANGISRERKGCPDRRETEALAAGCEAEVAKAKAGLIDPKDLLLREHEQRPIANHLADWKRDMLARGKTARHAEQFLERAGKLAALSHGSKLSDLETNRTRRAIERASTALAKSLNSTHLSDLTPDRVQAALAVLRNAGKSNQTVNHYRAALRAFAHWAVDKGRLNTSPLRGVKGFNVEEDRRHERRSLTDAELTSLIATAPVSYTHLRAHET